MTLVKKLGLAPGLQKTPVFPIFILSLLFIRFSGLSDAETVEKILNKIFQVK